VDGTSSGVCPMTLAALNLLEVLTSVYKLLYIAYIWPITAPLFYGRR
jgi:hypothetical protein